MADYFKKLYSTDPLFRALVQARLSELNGYSPSEDGGVPDGALSPDEELVILREYAITLYKEHKTLKNLFMESLKVSGKAIGLKDPSKPPKKT
ncbi:MAG: hypothetical protein OEV30_05200 [Ignavibacteria bacterium]|nr:hypothetical protein [Ignavibacteria bacterium]